MPVKSVRKQRRPVIVVGAGILVVACCAGVAGARLLGSAFPMNLSTALDVGQPIGKGDALAFSYMRLDLLRPFEVYVLDDLHGIRPVGLGIRRSDVGPSWSPDGTRMLYQSVSGGATRYWVVDPDGTNPRELTADDHHKALPRWSPDGTRLAYLVYHPQPDGSISNLSLIHISEPTRPY